MAWWDLTNLRTILTTETDADSGHNETTFGAMRMFLECLTILGYATGDDGSATTNPPNDATGVLTDSAGGYDVDEHNGRTLLITSGLAIGNLYTIDDTTATTLICTGDNLYSDGVRSGDTYQVFYDLKVNLDGHDHDAVNSKTVALADGQVLEAKIASSAVSQGKLKTTTEEQTLAGSSSDGRLTFSNVGSYGFYPQQKISQAGAVTAHITNVASGNLSTSYATILDCDNDAVGTYYAQIRYVTASGEYGWAFFLRDKLTGEIKRGWFSGDHPTLNDETRVHPFIEVYDPDLHSIDCIVLTKNQYNDLEVEAVKKNSSPLQLLIEDYNHTDVDVTPFPTEEITLGLPKIITIKDEEGNDREIVPSYRSLPDGTPVETIKKKVTKPEYINLKGIKLKAGGQIDEKI